MPRVLMGYHLQLKFYPYHFLLLFNLLLGVLFSDKKVLHTPKLLEDTCLRTLEYILGSTLIFYTVLVAILGDISAAFLAGPNTASKLMNKIPKAVPAI